MIMLEVIDMLPFILLSCVSNPSDDIKENPLLDADGETLLEEYNSAICDVYLQDGCIEAFGVCNEPIANYGDWADCMNSQYLSQSHCSNLPPLFEEDKEIVLECIDTLNTLDCQGEPQSACIGSDAIFQVGACGDVLRILLSNCSAFGS